MKKILPLLFLFIFLSGCQSEKNEPVVSMEVSDASNSPEIEAEGIPFDNFDNEIVESDLEIAEREALDQLNTLVNQEVLAEDNIIISFPELNQTISSPLTIEGEAVGKWYFEGAFLVRLMDEEGNELAIAPVTATEEWMTEALVPFVADLEFEPGDDNAGRLIFENDNPSGLPENALSFELPVQF